MLDLTKPIRVKHDHSEAAITKMKSDMYLCEYRTASGRWCWHTHFCLDDVELRYENVPETRTLTGCLNVYSNNFTSSVYEHRKTCDDIAAALPTDDRIACIDLSKYNITFEVGEGL